MVSFIAGIAVTLVTFYIALIYGSAAIGLFAFAEALLLVLAFFYLLFLRGQMDAAIRIPIGVTERGKKVSVQIVTTNRSHIPCMRVRCQLLLGNSFLRKGRRLWQPLAPVYAGENCCQASLGLPFAGNYSVGIRKMRIYDLTGLFYINKRLRSSAQVQVLPETACVCLRITERTRNYFGDSDVYDDFRPGNDRSEIFDVREFRDGDRIQSIHWKLTAKSDELIVREDASPLACPVVLLLESGLKKDLKTAEIFLSAASSLVFSLMDAHCPHYVSWYSGSRRDMVRVRVDDEEGYYIFLSSYLADSFGTPAMEPEKLYQEKYRWDRPLHSLVLKSDLTVWQNGKEAGAVDRKDWKKSMAELELIL